MLTKSENGRKNAAGSNPQRTSAAEKEYKKYAELYVKLGVLVGLAIIIVII